MVDTQDLPEVRATIALPLRTRHQPKGSFDLSVTSSGSAIPVTVERVPPTARPIALLLDASADVDEQLFATEQGAAIELLRQLDPAAHVLVGTSVGRVPGHVGDVQAAIARVGELSVGGARTWSAALDATLDAIGGIGPPDVIVISAGPAAVAVPAARSDVDERLVASAATVRWISLAADAGPTDDLAGILGVVTTSPAGLLVRLDSISHELVAQYLLSFRVDPRATSATVTLTMGPETWVAQTPLPLPVTVVLPAIGASQVASEAPIPAQPSAAQGSRDPPPRTFDRTTSPLARLVDFAADNQVWVLAAAVALLVLGTSTFAALTPSGSSIPRSQRSRRRRRSPPS